MYFDQEALLIQYYKTQEATLKEQIILSYRSLVEYIAKKMAFNKDDLEDLIQVGSIGLLKSLDRYKPSRDTDFATFATPNIIGEIKHYFRDKRHLVKIPRRLQELYGKIRQYIKTQSQEEHSSPTIKEIAFALCISEEDVLEAIEASQSTHIISLDAPVYGDNQEDDEQISLVDSLGVSPKDEIFLNEQSIKAALDKLGEREKQIIVMRYFEGYSQREIALTTNLSQMHVSRLLSYALKSLRKFLTQQKSAN